MKKSRFTEAQIVSILKEAEAGVSVGDLSRKHGISEASFYVCRKKFGGMNENDLKRLRQLEEENLRFADQARVAGVSRRKQDAWILEAIYASKK